MKAKDKANKLVAKFGLCGGMRLSVAKQCALIVVEEIFNDPIYKAFKIKPKYWQDVKDEINKL